MIVQNEINQQRQGLTGLLRNNNKKKIKNKLK
jgi:hypothetical protein